MSTLERLAAGACVLLVGALVAAWVHHGYALRNYRAAKAAVPPAREQWLSRLGTLVGWVALVAVGVGLFWLLATGPQR